jgi:hypothetical protein
MANLGAVEGAAAREAEGLIAKAAAGVLRDSERLVARDVGRDAESSAIRAAGDAGDAAGRDLARDAGHAGDGIAGDGITAPGPHAGESIPARGPERNWTAEEKREIDRIGQDTGCHRCGATTSGTKGGHHTPDHQPPSALNPDGKPQRLFPHCIACSRKQGGTIAQMNRRVGLR